MRPEEADGPGAWPPAAEAGESGGAFRALGVLALRFLLLGPLGPRGTTKRLGRFFIVFSATACSNPPWGFTVSHHSSKTAKDDDSCFVPLLANTEVTLGPGALGTCTPRAPRKRGADAEGTPPKGHIPVPAVGLALVAPYALLYFPANLLLERALYGIARLASWPGLRLGAGRDCGEGVAHARPGQEGLLPGREAILPKPALFALGELPRCPAVRSDHAN